MWRKAFAQVLEDRTGHKIIFFQRICMKNKSHLYSDVLKARDKPI